MHVWMDVRGRGDSDGPFVPYRNDGRDGYDAIEWCAAQPWSDGNVGTIGGSYDGRIQWLAAIERPPHLRAMNRLCHAFRPVRRVADRHRRADAYVLDPYDQRARRAEYRRRRLGRRL